MPTHETAGRSLVTRRAVIDVIRSATLASYGVTGFAAGWRERLLGALGIGQPGIRVRLGEQPEIALHLTVAHGLPIAEVARQVDSAVRYAVERALGRKVGRLTIHVNGLRYQPSLAPSPVPGNGSGEPGGGVPAGAGAEDRAEAVHASGTVPDR